MNHLNREPVPIEVPPETEYLITDIEELVNDNVGNYLNDKTFRIKVSNFMPAEHEIRNKKHLPIGINRIERDVIQSTVPGMREFIGMDLLFTFPLAKGRERQGLGETADENPINITLKWSGDVHAVLAIVDDRPIMLVTHGENSEEVLAASQPNRDVMRTYLETIGLPDSIWSDDFKDLLGDIYFSPDIEIDRSSKHPTDLGTTIEMKHTARYLTDDDEKKELIQELCLNIDHTSEPRYDGLVFPGMTFRNMFRFERSNDNKAWEYRGAYAGKLVSGEFIDQPVQEDPKLGVPGSKLLEKAFYFLSQQEVPKEERL